ncbi:MAG: amidohydrolase family protein [Planctomycetota bacterium]|nr:amidohydrolase family protein [Planctomycetota bacterium]
MNKKFLLSAFVALSAPVLLFAAPEKPGKTPGKAAKKDIATETPEDRIPKRRAEGRPVLIKNATILPVVGETIAKGDIYIVEGKIKAIGSALKGAKNALVIDASGQFVMPGVIDCHSHIAIEGGLNEMSEKLSPEVRIGDVVNHEDVSIYRALAGGVTSALLLHGSANPIGGQAQVIKLRYGKSAPDLHFKRAPRGIKMALGENPTRRSGFPKTRQGVMMTMRRAFTEGRAYLNDWKKYRAAKAAGKNVVPPRRDLRLETYAGILSGDIKVHCHCYRSDEIVMLIKVAEEFGFKIATFQHVLDGYKVAPEIARHGAGGSTFSDWWAYKIEAFDAIPHNAALMTRAGVTVSINSDSGELIRHLPLEAAKSARYGGLNENQILRLVTLNPAKQLGIDNFVGSIEVGKDADLSIWNGHPLSIFSRTVMTLVDGEVYFDKQGKRHSKAPEGFAIPKHKGNLRFKVQKEGRYAIKDAMIHPVSDTPFRGTILFAKGKIVDLGPKVTIPKGYRVIDGKGLTVTPGLIDSGTELGLTEIGSADETQDVREAGRFQPDLIALEGVHPHSELIPVTRLAGTTTALTLPSGGSISGQASVIHLDGVIADEMKVVKNLGLVMNIPAKSTIKPITEYLKKARVYHKQRRANAGTKLHPQYEAMIPYLQGEKPVIVNVQSAKAIVDVVEWARKQKLELILRGARDAWKVADYLAARKVRVIIGPIMAVPRGAFLPYDSAYKNAVALQKAGVLYAIQSGDASNARILPFEAGMAAAFGLSPEQALHAITLAPAQIMGMDHRYGSLEKGKVADLIISSGHPLEPSSRVVGMFIKGRKVRLESKQTRLARRFKKRIDGIAKKRK